MLQYSDSFCTASRRSLMLYLLWLAHPPLLWSHPGAPHILCMSCAPVAPWPRLSAAVSDHRSCSKAPHLRHVLHTTDIACVTLSASLTDVWLSIQLHSSQLSVCASWFLYCNMSNRQQPAAPPMEPEHSWPRFLSRAVTSVLRHEDQWPRPISETDLHRK